MNFYEIYPKLRAVMSEQESFKGIDFLENNQGYLNYSYEGLLRMLNEAKTLNEVRAVSIVYKDLKDSFIELELTEVLQHLNCPSNTIDIFIIISKEVMKDKNKLYSLIKLTYPVVMKKYNIASATVNRRIRESIEVMYVNNDKEIKRICGDYDKSRCRFMTPPTQLFIEGLIKAISQKEEIFKGELSKKESRGGCMT